MTDLRQIMADGVPDRAPPSRLPPILPWALVAVVLIAISLSIHFFWPVPSSEPLAECPPGGEAAQTACIRHEPDKPSHPG